MGAAAAELADRAIVTDDNPRSESPQAIVAEIVEGAKRLTPHAAHLTVIHDRAAAIRTAVADAARDDVVVVAGKGHEDYQIYGSDVRAFSDRAFVATLVGTEARA
jgi:UDP-N-acetylmuramoyl-L-alanyl-D-glutamate--2,6-diaminopimelate ligase